MVCVCVCCVEVGYGGWGWERDYRDKETAGEGEGVWERSREVGVTYFWMPRAVFIGRKEVGENDDKGGIFFLLVLLVSKYTISLVH